MKRMTYWCDNGMGGGEWRVNVKGVEENGEHVDRLASIEDILGDEYDLDRLRELVEACKGLEPSEIVESKLLIATRKDPEKLARMAKLVEADRDGRCVVLNGKDKRNKTIRDLVRLIHWVCASVRKHDFSPFRIVEGAPENTFPVVSKYDQLIEEHEDEIYTAFKDEEVNKSTRGKDEEKERTQTN